MRSPSRRWNARARWFMNCAFIQPISGRSSANRARRFMPSGPCCKWAARKRDFAATLNSSKSGPRLSRRGEGCGARFPRRLRWTMKIDVLTLFPAMFAGPLDESIVKRARAMGRLELTIHNLRNYTHDRHRTVDDRPFGGGPGMLLKPEPIFEAVENLGREETRVVLLTPVGRTFTQAIARELAEQQHLLFVAGSYEGFDERVCQALADDELSIGDYVLTNGAL